MKKKRKLQKGETLEKEWRPQEGPKSIKLQWRDLGSKPTFLPLSCCVAYASHIAILGSLFEFVGSYFTKWNQ